MLDHSSWLVRVSHVICLILQPSHHFAKHNGFRKLFSPNLNHWHDASGECGFSGYAVTSSFVASLEMTLDFSWRSAGIVTTVTDDDGDSAASG